MKNLIIYDSIFGNTEQIAKAIGAGLGSPTEVELLKAGDINTVAWAELSLLIVGSPTRGFRPTPAVTHLLGSIPGNGLKGVKVAAFDTRIAIDDVDAPFMRVIVRTFGYAAKPIADRLTKRGGDLILPPEGFLVKTSEGPLKDGELERAVNWAKLIAGSGKQ